MNYLAHKIKPLPKKRVYLPREGFPESAPPTNVIRQIEYARIYDCPPTLISLLAKLGYFGEDIVRDSKNTAWLIRCKANNERGRRLRDMMVSKKENHVRTD